jgi:hypothetical protein
MKTQRKVDPLVRAVRLARGKDPVSEAWAWLKRRYHVCESLELSTDTGLVIKIRPRAQRKAGSRGPRRVSFGRPEQFEFSL